jgi:hypothetical protein
VGVVVLTGCSKPTGDLKPPKSIPVKLGAQGGLPRAPTSPANTARIDEARVRVELAAVRSAVREHQMLNGSSPPGIGVLDLKLRFEADLQYDPATGQVKSRTYPQY